jgi:hypothetical protein
MAKHEESVTEHQIEDFAEELGRLLGNAKAKADSWLDQRQQIAKALEGVRDTASGLLSKLGHEALAVVKRRGRPAAAAAKSAVEAPAAAVAALSGVVKKKRRKMSAEARKAISDAQKARWAKQRGEKKK